MKNPPSAAPAGAPTSEQPTGALTEIVAAGNPSKKAPRLKNGKDSEVASELGRLVRDAQDGTRRILICGLFIETIVANLKHGELGPWIDAHEKEIGAKRTQVFAWRQFSQEVSKQVGIQKSDMPDFSIPLHQALALPAAEVPEDAREVRAKIDELIEGRSVRQLMFQFREATVVEDQLVRSGRGGDRTAHRTGIRRTAAEKDYDDKEHRALEWYKFGFLNLRECALHPGDTWIHLPDEELANVADLAKRFAKEADEVCRARKIVPSQMATWQADVEGH